MRRSTRADTRDNGVHVSLSRSSSGGGGVRGESLARDRPMKPRESSSGRGHFRESRKWLFPTKFAGRASGVQARRQSFAGEEKFRRRSLHRPITIVPRSFDQARGGAEDRREEGGEGRAATAEGRSRSRMPKLSRGLQAARGGHN
jgi:hypothetical protein